PSSLDSDKIMRGEVWAWEREGQAPPDKSPTPRRIQGRWHLASVKIRNNERPIELIKNCRMTISDGQMRIENSVELSGQIDLHAGSNQIDFKWAKDPLYDVSGIYEFLDDDTLRIRTQPKPLGRPSGFEMDGKSVGILRILKRSGE